MRNTRTCHKQLPYDGKCQSMRDCVNVEIDFLGLVSCLFSAFRRFYSFLLVLGALLCLFVCVAANQSIAIYM